VSAWFEVGSADNRSEQAIAPLAAAARAAGLRTRYVVLPGANHTWLVWHRSFEQALPWLYARLTEGRPADVRAAGPR
jgi:S-formylglutathione hydrolase FrmB